MTTAYVITDTTFKDLGGAKLISWVDISTSQLDFALPAGIGTKTASSKNYAALFTGNTVSGSKVETPQVGTMLMGAFTTNASIVATNAAIPLRASDRGELYVSGLSSVAAAYAATSHDTVTLASGILYTIIAAACGAQPGGQVRIMNGATSLTHLSFSQNSDTIVVQMGTGVCYGSLITERVNTSATSAAVFVTLIAKNWGQGG